MSDKPAKTYLVIAGPTGSGKSSLALELAAKLNGEIISCDSVQVYRGFDIGAAKPTAAERAAIPHHLIDVVDWQADYDAARYALDAKAAMASVRTRGRLPIVVGGTGLYLRALLGQGWHADLPSDQALRQELSEEKTADLYERLKGLDPVRAAEIHANDRFRVVRSLELATLLGKPLRDAGLVADPGTDPEACVVVLNPERAKLHRSIEVRTALMLKQGMVGEVKTLLNAGVAPTCKPMTSIGYKQVADFLLGKLAEERLEPAIVAATRQYAKRQVTWFRKVNADQRFSEWTAQAVCDAWHSRVCR